MKSKYYIVLLTFFMNLICYGQIREVNMEASSKWNQSFDGITKIKVHWENPSPNNYQERDWVEEAIKETWEKYANVNFLGWKAYDYSGKGIRILIDDSADPHCKGLGNALDGNYAGMVLNFNFTGKFKCNIYSRKHCIKAIAVHEFGHALGIAHEQDKAGCGCAENTAKNYDTNGYYITPCDINSVMNYCNSKWNNDGHLSDYDIKGIQAVYGERQTNDSYKEIAKTGNLSIYDELGIDQVWENLNLTFGGTTVIFNISETNPRDIKQINISKSGYYKYSISSKTKRENGKWYNGLGSGKLYLDKNKNYRLNVYMQKYEGNSFTIFLEATNLSKDNTPLYNEQPQKNETYKPKKSRLIIKGEKPIALLKFYNNDNEKYYIYPNGTIYVYVTDTDKYYKCSKKEPATYKTLNGKKWAWSFKRPIGNNKTETYNVTINSKVWATTTNNTLNNFGYLIEL